MVLADYMGDIRRCSRCSYCKWIPLAKVKSQRFARGCPSVEYRQFQSHSACGRLSLALSLLLGRIDYSDPDTLLEVVYQCTMDGLCDISCKICRYNLEPLEILRELRFKLVEDGLRHPRHLTMIESLSSKDNTMMRPVAERGDWAWGLDLKDLSRERAEIVFHAGCHFSFDLGLRDVVRTAATLLKAAGVDFGIMGRDEICCGGRVNDMGYRKEFAVQAQKNITAFTQAGVTTVVTSCSDCYYTFKRLYPDLGSSFEVIHTVEFIDRLIKDGRLRLTRPIPLKVTYHDPCHLGRQGEPYVPWKGREKKIRNQIVVYEPPKPRYSGAWGVYDPPREVLKSIPGLELVEMERIREYAWCCGAGGGVQQTYPDFSSQTARERIEEARSTGAEAMVTACPGCERNFIDTVVSSGSRLKVYDIVELVREAIFPGGTQL